MRARKFIVIGASVMAVIAIACGGDDTPGDRNEPQAGEQETSSEPLVTPPPGCTPEGPKVAVSSTDMHFNEECVGAPADTAFTIDYENGKCTGCSKRTSKHNVSIYTADLAREQVFRGKIIPTRTEISYNVPPLEAGVYVLQCIVHSPMNGILVVE